MNTNSIADTTNATLPLPLLVSSNNEEGAKMLSNISSAATSSSTQPTIITNMNSGILSTMQAEQRMKKVEEKCEALIMQNMALTQRLELTEMQLEESKVLNMQLKQAIQVARTEEKDKSDIVKMRLDSLERRTYYMERYFLSGATTM